MQKTFTLPSGEETTMNKVPDRAKMRREFLCNRGKVYGLEVIGSIMWVYCGIPALGCALFLGYLLFVADGFAPVQLTVLQWMLGLGAIAFCGKRLQVFSINKAKSIPVIPAMSKQLPTLPADEVLLRGAQPLPASSEELLRPAGKVETKAEDLLRASVE